MIVVRYIIYINNINFQLVFVPQEVLEEALMEEALEEAAEEELAQVNWKFASDAEKTLG